MGIGRYFSVLQMVRFDYYKYRYRKQNKNNNTVPGNRFDFNKVIVGDYTYGTINVVDYSNDKSKLIIGDYCSIAAGVQFLLGGEHSINSISTFPFKVYRFGYNNEAKSKGNIEVGMDVWIGQNAIICSGVKIGQGAIIGAGAVVTKDVEPYAIIAGNPARVIRKRFSEELIETLSNVDLKKMFDSFTNEDVELIYSCEEEDIKRIISKYHVEGN